MFVLALVSSALVAGAALCAADQRRTHAARTNAELRQLLIAGAQDVSRRASRWSSAVQHEKWNVALPPDLNGASLSVDIETAPDGTLAAAVRAALGAQNAEQELIYRRAGKSWKLERIAARIP
jgi:hypothetical protein